ncbi:MAG TPA: hypothetical protein DCW95_08480 [Chryseobacterium sp.]|nr:hypothetical protein [Chryseobacterium sp.]
MKNLLLLFVCLLSLSLAGQTTYEKAMTEKIAQMDEAKTPEEFTAASHAFIRIAEKEKTQYLPYYYAALSTVARGRVMMRDNDFSTMDAITTEAQKQLDKAIELNKDDSELYVVQKMIHGLRMLVNPQERYMTESKLGLQALAKAEQLSPENPRITLLRAEDMYFTPAQFGGDKEKAVQLFQKALAQYDRFKPATPLHPNWGKEEAVYFINQKP